MDKQKVMTAWGDCELVNYSNREEIAKVYPDALFMGNEEKGDFGFITTTADSVKIVWRGSDDELDWLSNLGIDTNSGLIEGVKSIRRLHNLVNEDGYHRGFHDAMEEYIKPIASYITSSNKNNILVIGHSRGGALALDTAGRLCHNNYQIEAIVFGCPKMCTKSSALYRSIAREEISVTSSGIKKTTTGNVRIAQYINGIDIVPRLPFEFPWNKKLIRAGDVYGIGRSLNFKETIKMIRFYFTGTGKFEYTDDHRQKEYRPALVEHFG